MPSIQAASWVLVCCLALAGFGFLVSHGGGSSSSSSEAASSTSGQAPSPAAGAAGLPNGRLQPEHAGDEPSAASSASAAIGYLVYSTGTAYKRSTLASQVQRKLITYGFASLTPTTPANSASATAPADSAPASTSASASLFSGHAPLPQLSDCVSAVTDGVAPSLVDKGSYDGIPAYIIVAPTEVWVVRLGCTAAHTELIVRVPLKG
jgi:hypothetical protein